MIKFGVSVRYLFAAVVLGGFLFSAVSAHATLPQPSLSPSASPSPKPPLPCATPFPPGVVQMKCTIAHVFGSAIQGVTAARYCSAVVTFTDRSGLNPTERVVTCKVPAGTTSCYGSAFTGESASRIPYSVRVDPQITERETEESGCAYSPALAKDFSIQSSTSCGTASSWVQVNVTHKFACVK